MGPFQPTQVSRVNRDLPDVPLGRTEVVHWKSKDSQEIEGLLTYPVGYEKGKRYPLLLVIHGGPMGAFMQTYDGTATYYPIAAFASRGYAVLRANVRGSSGYGKKFRFANYGDWGGGDYKDLMSGVDHVIDLGVADPDRLGVMGWSYGGYMTSWIITQTHRFKAASVGARRDEPDELHRHCGHSQFPARLLRRRVLGQAGSVPRTLGHVPRQGRDHADARSSTANATSACRCRRARSCTTRSSARDVRRRW